MLGDDACERLRQSHVTIVGLGAVGSYALEALARSGIGHLRLVDFDVVAPSNINRQLLALSSTIGRRKCDLARERALDINPNCQVEAIGEFVDGENVFEMVGESPDLVIDAIDALNPKVQLLASLRTNEIRVISCLGAAMRFDPSRVRTGTIETVCGCPLGKSVKTRLRRQGVPLDIPCVFSSEPLPKPLPIAPPATITDENLGIARGRARNTLGSLPTLTGIFGLTAANLALKMLIESSEGNV
jgi:tRNA A37 threonylcarbamoyladenosine dehydratase